MRRLLPLLVGFIAATAAAQSRVALTGATLIDGRAGVLRGIEELSALAR